MQQTTNRLIGYIKSFLLYTLRKSDHMIKFAIFKHENAPTKQKTSCAANKMFYTFYDVA